jgi:hypothetical protein
MSLYIFGTFVSHDRSDGVEARVIQAACRADVAIRAIDPDDLLELEREPELRRADFACSFVSAPGESDGTKLWLDARRAAVESGSSEQQWTGGWKVGSVPGEVMVALQASRLGRLCKDLIGEVPLSAGALALVDGSIDTVSRCSPSECLDVIHRSLVLPWDAGPNALYLWTRKKGS